MDAEEEKQKSERMASFYRSIAYHCIDNLRNEAVILVALTFCWISKRVQTNGHVRNTERSPTRAESDSAPLVTIINRGLTLANGRLGHSWLQHGHSDKVSVCFATSLVGFMVNKLIVPILNHSLVLRFEWFTCTANLKLHPKIFPPFLLK